MVLRALWQSSFFCILHGRAAKMGVTRTAILDLGRVGADLSVQGTAYGLRESWDGVDR